MTFRSELRKESNKKYYSASEVIKHLNIALHQLRYLETKIPDLSNYKINNRKYYTVNDIDLLQKSCYKTSYTKINLEKSNRPVSRGAERTEVREHLKVYKDDVANFGGSSSRIDILLTNFHNLSFQIKKILADSSMICV
ncbi:palindromic element RPE5 domain-containing protein [Rickettsia asembonensis]|uniref:palindromic element RPE5 domain-containing protein n=1 Tax=Rickettsia asembonensis TaxID=1068590 RepID=UPI0023F67B62|nr:palindromic element RPE5 domain-containing protein [Rickettsia asembonensis]